MWQIYRLHITVRKGIWPFENKFAPNKYSRQFPPSLHTNASELSVKTAKESIHALGDGWISDDF